MESTAEWFARFARNEARGRSKTYENWATNIALDEEVLAKLDELDRPKRQPNLLFASARWHGCPIGEYAEWREWLLANWPAVKETASAGYTQTNEVGRCAPLLLALTQIEGPIALLEVGASAGLCLLPERYSYQFGERARLDPAGGASPVVLECEVMGAAPVATSMPRIVWRAGIDLAPLDVRSDDDARWLDALVWPDNLERRQRLASAIEVAREDPPRIVRGDATAELAALAADAPRDARLVVVTMGVLVYLKRPEREAFVDEIGRLDASWIALESAPLFAPVADQLTSLRPGVANDLGAHFALTLDGKALALAGPHGQFVDWL